MGVEVSYHFPRLSHSRIMYMMLEILFVLTTIELIETNQRRYYHVYTVIKMVLCTVQVAYVSVLIRGNSFWGTLQNNMIAVTLSGRKHATFCQFQIVNTVGFVRRRMKQILWK